ncbi:MAG: hypothetical protein A2284_03265 [Deltaproteobacteria bacterium RIFOXYA12_FULL_61_11]|nr:MAG: hypothetical protein A2284_03265 [Deltaproteobacteria bacterium RIFOXYA12_FULL_61_11]
MQFQPRFTNLVTMLQQAVERNADRPLFGSRKENGWQWTTYREFSALVDRCRGGLAALGVGQGDRVALISNNRLEWAVTVFAGYGLGAAYVAMYENQLPRDWQYILADSSATVCLVANQAIKKTLEGMRDQLGALRHLVVFDAEQEAEDGFAALLARGAGNPVPITVPPDEAHACFIYTSGTTGKPKGTRLTQRNLAINVCGVQEVIPFCRDDRSLAFLPWAHVFGGSIEMNNLISLGASMAICESNDRILPYLVEVRPTVLIAVPRIWNRIYDGVNKQMAAKPALIRSVFRAGLSASAKKRRGETLSLSERVVLFLAERLIFSKIRGKFGGRLKYALSGAAALSQDVADFIDNLGIEVFEGYGMTEIAGVTSVNRPGAKRRGSVGLPIPAVAITIDSSVTGTSEREGEIILSGPCVLDGYHNLPEETAACLTPEGHLRTGDLGYIDADGYLTITGRIKELYKMANGKYVAPAALEEQLALSPFILQAMVYGDDRMCNVALIVPDLAALKEWAAHRGLPLSERELLGRAEVRALFENELKIFSAEFKHYERIDRFLFAREEFSVANGLLTPTLKLKRRIVLEQYGNELATLF